MNAKADESGKAEKLPGTVVITDFSDRRSREVAREELPTDEYLPPGTKLGRYVITGRLGGGGMGIVYKADDTELRRAVALKVLPPHLCRHPDYLNRFRSEAHAHARLNSPNVITLYSLLELPAGEVLVLEYVDGQSLEQRLKLDGPLDPADAVVIFDQALRAVQHIHAAGVVHRDLKPGNIFLARDGTVKLMDFGVAKLMDQPEHSAQRTMVGTLLYISPEQINGHSTDFRSDIYTLGVSLFEAVTGRLPFERRTDYALMHAHVQERPPRPKKFQHQLTPVMESVILKAIEKDPARRFQSAAEFRTALLKLGLIKRRQREHGAGEAQRVAYRRVPASLTRGLWFDAALIAAVVALIYTLGIYPVEKNVDVANFTPATQDTDANLNSTVATRRASTAKNTAPKDRPHPEASYDVLRDAWGD
jgi:serine/threonine protein kinase